MLRIFARANIAFPPPLLSPDTVIQKAHGALPIPMRRRQNFSLITYISAPISAPPSPAAVIFKVPFETRVPLPLMIAVGKAKEDGRTAIITHSTLPPAVSRLQHGGAFNNEGSMQLSGGGIIPSVTFKSAALASDSSSHYYETLTLTFHHYDTCVIMKRLRMYV